jgi:hypothetical protein
MQVSSDGHDTPVNWMSGSGRDEALHVVPPLCVTSKMLGGNPLDGVPLGISEGPVA